MENSPKLSNFKVLCETLTKYRVVNPKEKETKEEATANFLRKGEKLELPIAVQIISKTGEPGDYRLMPYRIFPTAALESLNSSVRFLEYCLQRDNTPNQIEPEARTNPYNDPTIREGALQLATILIPNCLISPEREYQGKNSPEPSPEDAAGGTLLHRANPKDPRKPIPTKRAKILKGLLGRLEKYELIRLATLKSGALETSPALQEIQRLQYLFDQEIRASLNAWKLLRDDVLEQTKHLDDMAYGEAQEALKDASHGEEGYDSDLNEDPLDQEEAREDQQRQQTYYGEAQASSPTQEETERKRRNLPCEPDGWLWKETTDPMQVITSYVSEELLPRIEEQKEKFLADFQNPAKSQKEKQDKLFLLPEKKYNPNDYWKLATALSKEIPEEDTEISKRLSSARFAVCLRETNLTKNIPHGDFLQEWEKTVSEHLDGTKPQASRNHALLATLKRIDQSKDWNTQQINQWLEHLQTLAPGGYENSSSQEKNRTQILQTLNKMLASLKEGLGGNKDTSEEALERTMKKISEGITNSLSGPTGQTVRREIRYHIKTLKDEAVSQGEKVEAENFRQLWNWLTNISSQIKDGTWFEPETQEATQKVVRGMIVDILSREIGKERDTFTCSPTPEGKNETLINIEFLKSISKDNANQGFAGRYQLNHRIFEAKNQIDDTRVKNLGTTLPTKVWSREKNIENLPNKIRAAQKAEELLETLPKSKESLQNLYALADLHLERIVNKPANDQEAEETMAFWEAMQSFAENIRMRKDKPQFQPTPLGRKMIRRCAQMAREHYTGIQTVPSHLRESMTRNSRRVILLSNAIAPIGLWINAPIKGKNENETTHEEVIASFRERRENRQEIHKLFDKHEGKNLENQVKTETMVSFALNLSAMDDISKFISKPEELSQGLLWQHRNQTQVKLLTEQFPQKDTPIERLATINPTKKIETSKAAPIMEMA